MGDTEVRRVLGVQLMGGMWCEVRFMVHWLTVPLCIDACGVCEGTHMTYIDARGVRENLDCHNMVRLLDRVKQWQHVVVPGV